MGRDYSFKCPIVMGILNLTPDSFFEGSRFSTPVEVVQKTEEMLQHGAGIIDLGAISTRPGAKEISQEEEAGRLIPALRRLVRMFPKTAFSIDTYRSEIARMCIEEGAVMINDISGGRFDPNMKDFIGAYNIPYIMMHMHGTPETMQNQPLGNEIMNDIHKFFSAEINRFQQAGASQLILDPGFGFGKTLNGNYIMLRRLDELRQYGYPVLAGMSRKSMISKVLGINSTDALNGTTVVNTIALLHGAELLRVHDVREASEVAAIVDKLQEAGIE
jgi:dihydropteroate synthase